MLLKDFKQGINKVDLELRLLDCDIGVCSALQTIVGDRTKEYFRKVMCPYKDTNSFEAKYTYWLGFRTLRELENRLNCLRVFEAYCISEKLYKEM